MPVGVTKCLDRDPGPERPVFFPGQVPAGPGDRVFAPDLGGGPGTGRGPVQHLAVAGELLAGIGRLGGGEPFGAGAGLSLNAGHQGRQGREAFSGALVHPGLAPADLLHPGQVFAAHRRGCRPGTPAGGFLHRPLGDVEVEGADLPELGAPVGSQVMGLDDLSAGTCGTGDLEQDPLLPGRRDVGSEVQRADSRVVDLQVTPEQPPEGGGQAAQCGVVQGRCAFEEVLVQQVPDRLVFDAEPLQHLLGAELPLGGESPKSGGASAPKTPIECRAS